MNIDTCSVKYLCVEIIDFFHEKKTQKLNFILMITMEYMLKMCACVIVGGATNRIGGGGE